MAAVSDNLDKQTRDLILTERKHAEQTEVYNERASRGKADVQAISASVDDEFALLTAQIAAATEQLLTEDRRRMLMCQAATGGTGESGGSCRHVVCNSAGHSASRARQLSTQSKATTEGFGATEHQGVP